jgi:hypothetical protein
MIPAIGLMIGAYIIWRAIEAMLNCCHGGAYADMGEGVCATVVVFSIALIIIAGIGCVSLIGASNEATKTLSTLQTTMGNLR